MARFSAPVRLEQHRGGRQPDALVVVAGRDQGDGRAVAADAGDDGAEHVGELGLTTSSRSASVLDGADLQQRDQLTGAGQAVLDEAVVAELDQFLGADPGGAQYLDGRPCPERAVFVGGQVAVFPGGQVFGPDASGGAAGGGAGQGLPGGGDDVAGAGAAGGLQQGGRVGVLPGGAADQDRQDGEPFAGAGVHP